MKIAFFDFDGTITRGDSLFVFMRFLLGKKVFYLGILKNLHYLLGYALGIIGNSRAKERLVGYFLKGMLEEELLKRSRDFLPVLEKMCKKSAIDQIRWHQDRGDKIIVVSATFGCYLSEWCKKMKLEYLSTELEVIQGKLSGKFATPNCYGVEKVQRIQETYDLKQYQEIYAYGDSQGDKEMLKLATHSFFRYFK